MPALRNFKSQKKQMDNEKQSNDEVIYTPNVSKALMSLTI